MTIAETVRSFREVLDGKHDDLPEGVFLLKGSIDDVVKAAGRGEEKDEQDEGDEAEGGRDDDGSDDGGDED